MKRSYVDLAIDSITKLKSEVEKHKNRVGKKKLAEILCDHFALSADQAENLIELINEMIPDVHYEAIPKDWFFDPRVKQRGRTWLVLEKIDDKFRIIRRCKSLKGLAPEIRKDRDEIRNTIQLCWKLPDKEKNIVIPCATIINAQRRQLQMHKNQ